MRFPRGFYSNKIRKGQNRNLWHMSLQILKSMVTQNSGKLKLCGPLGCCIWFNGNVEKKTVVYFPYIPMTDIVKWSDSLSIPIDFLFEVEVPWFLTHKFKWNLSCSNIIHRFGVTETCMQITYESYGKPQRKQTTNRMNSLDYRTSKCEKYRHLI